MSSAIDLRLGDWREVLADVESVDAVICDPPYSKRTHESAQNRTYDAAARDGAISDHYSHFDGSHVGELIDGWSERCHGWLCALTDHVLAPIFERHYLSAGRYAFAPVPVIERGRNVRLAGDGPACWALWLMVARTKSISKWGALPGGYVVGRSEKLVPGGKGLELMRAIVRDYSRPGDLIVDPCAGGGTTLIAAAMEGRRAIGAEIDPDTYAKAKARIDRGYTPSLFTGAKGSAGAQGDLI